MSVPEPPPPEAAVKAQQTIAAPSPTPASPQDSFGNEETHGLQQERPWTLSNKF